MTVEELQVLITAQTSGLEKQINGIKGQLSGLEKHAAKTSNGISGSFSKIGKAFKMLMGAAVVKGLVNVGKQAINLASDLQEVQNVVDVAFGSAAKEIDNFASTAITKLGMSEYTAKHMASTFMSMSNGMGIATDAGKTMSIELTKLAGDMASFYNVEQDVAQTALNSVFTGETESLKKFGVVMTEANLNAFALSRGITKAYNSMSQSEKVMLRYQYVMQATSQAQGDFARTSNSWANQTRILKEQWSQLLGIMGKGLTAVLTPVVQSLNKLLGYLISIGNAIAKVFGGKGIKSAAASVQDSASGAGAMADSMEDTASGADKANESAKKLQKTLGSFDELNVMADNSGSGSGSGSGGGSVGSGGGLGSTITADTMTEETEEEGIKGRLKDFIEDCKGILEKWADTIPKLEFNFDTQKALDDLQKIATDIVNVIAGWGSFIITIAIDIANDLDLGNLIQKFIELTSSFTGLASAMTDALVPAFEIFYEKAISPLVKALGEILGDAFDTGKGILDSWAKWFVDHKKDISDFAEKLGDILRPLADIVVEISKAAWGIFRDIIVQISDAIQQLATWIVTTDKGFNTFVNVLKVIAGLKILDVVVGFKGLWTSIKAGYPILSYFGDLIKAPFQLLGGWIGTAISNFKIFFSAIGQMFAPIATAVGGFFTKVGAWFAGAWQSVSGFFAAFGTVIAGVVSLIGGIVAAVVGFFQMWKDGWNIASEILKDLGIALAAVGAVLLGVAAAPAAIVAAVVAAVSTIIIVCKDHWAEISAFFKKVGKWIGDFFSDLWDDISDWFSDTFDKIKRFFDKFVDGTKEFISNIIQTVAKFLTTLSANLVAGFAQIKEKTAKAWNAIKEFFSNWWSNLTQFFQKSVNAIKDLLSKAWDAIKSVISTAWNGIKNLFKTLWSGIKDVFTTAVNAIKDFLSKAWDSIKSVITTVWNAIKTFIKNIWNSIKSIITSILTSIKDFITSAFNAIKDKISTIMNSVKSNISSILNAVQKLWTNMCNNVKKTVNTWKSNLSTAVNAIKTTFSTVFNAVKTKVTGVFTSMKTAVINTMNALKTGLKTPINGILGFINGLIRGVVNGINNMISAMNRLKFDVPDWVPGIGGKKFGFNISKISAPQIPMLANGGVITSPTVAMMGEYAGASSNPEIVTPQNILRETMAESNEDLIDTLIQLNRQLISAISALNMEVKIGDDVIGKSVQRANDRNIRMTGMALI